MNELRDPDILLALASSVAPAGRSPELRTRLLSSVQRTGRFGIFVDRIQRLFDLPEHEAARYLRALEDPSSWAPSFLAGAAILPIAAGPRSTGAIATFARFTPGLTFPAHTHLGDEITFVLEGALRDSTGRVVVRGDELFKPEGSLHGFVVTDDGECIAAALAQGGIDLCVP